MSSFDIATLEGFYRRLSVQDGMGVAEFQADFRKLFKLPRATNDLNDYRLSKQPWKKLADEVSPVSRFLRFQEINSGRIQFPLDDQPPDCWLWQDGGTDKVGIEVTIAQARERYHLRKELVDRGQGRGFIGISDDAPQADFDHAMSRQRETHSTDQALSAIKAGILRCMSRKDKPRFAGFILLIQAPSDSLPGERWEAIKDDLCAAAIELPFREVHVLGNTNEEPMGFQIK